MNSIHENHRRFVIIHGHFYQPPRENPWLGFIERQGSAAPFRHWTERITEECYRANTFSPLLARGGRIAELVNNFEHLSFNVGPTLLDWLEPNAPEVYRRIIEGDRRSAERLGHGNAIAQGYNHAILPLCTREDKRTQILWGLEDFRRRFGRRSEGIWLPETAVDLETVELLIECGVGFTVLAPSQLEAVRPLEGNSQWDLVENPAAVVHRQPYRLFGREREAGHLDVFFFHPALSREISFDHLLRDGRAFSRRLGRSFDAKKPAPQAVVVATDGETFGHHEPFGNMCLSWVFRQPEEKRGYRLANFGLILERFPPALEARLQPGPDGEGTSWSCAHGVGRWTRDCGCATGAEEGWNQQWRTPLRIGLNRLRERVDAVLSRELGGEPDGERVEFRELPPEPGPGDPADAEANSSGTDLGERSRWEALRELHYYSQLMFTSCGWFFNDISGLEPVQNLFYARRVTELLARQFGEQSEEELLTTLRSAVSNVAGKGHGARIYRRDVLPRTLSAVDLVASTALLACFGVEQPLGRHGEQRVEPVTVERIRRGSLVLDAGWSRLRSRLSPRPRPFLHLALQTEAGGCRAWAEAAEERQVESVFRELLASLARSSEEEISDGYAWHIHRESRLRPAFRRQLEDELLGRQARESARCMLELHGTGRDLFLRAYRDRKEAAAAHPSPAELALRTLFADRVAEALADGGRRAHRPAAGMLRMARALNLPLDTSAGETAVAEAIGRSLESPDLLASPAPVKRALKVSRMAIRLGLDPAGSRTLQIRLWEALRQRLKEGQPAQEAASGMLRLAELLGFHRRSLETRFEDRPRP